ncbi:hypothetical protein B0H13DRAFT_1854511 [Mycena leptocephala]|nr:hypothetical protein B0H13DRAFT_1854511 [Mycena leptocephala]
MADDSDKPAELILSIIKSVVNARSTSAGNMPVDLIDLGQSIKRSIEKSTKVGENRRRIRDLTHDVLRTLADLSNLTQMHEDTFQALALLDALRSLKAAIPPVHRPGLNGFPSQIKVWMKRDDLEKKIGRLKEHVNQMLHRKGLKTQSRDSTITTTVGIFPAVPGYFNPSKE